MLWQLFGFSKNSHSISFKHPWPCEQNLLVEWEESWNVNIEIIDDTNGRSIFSSNTMAPVMVPRGRAPPLGAILCTHDFYLPDFDVYVAPKNFFGEWTTFTEIEAESRREHDRDFPQPLSAHSSSSSPLPRIFTVDDTLPNTSGGAAGASAAQASGASASRPGLRELLSASASAPASSSSLAAPKRSRPL